MFHQAENNKAAAKSRKLRGVIAVLGLWTVVANGQPISPLFVGTTHTNIIGFNNLTGMTGDAFFSYSEGDFSITVDSGFWYKAFFYGAPAPDILLGPTNGLDPHGVAAQGSIIINDPAAGSFTFAGFDYSVNSQNARFLIEEHRTNGTVLTDDVTLSSFGPTNKFVTYFNPYFDPTNQLSSLTITIFPDGVDTSINLDNIMVTSVPEPGVLALAGTGFAGLLLLRRVSRRGRRQMGLREKPLKRFPEQRPQGPPR